MTARTCTPLLLSLALCLASSAQVATAPRLGDTAVPSAAPGAPYTLNVIVTDSKGHPVPNLPATAFILQANGTQQPLQHVRPTGDTGKVLLVIDAVNASYTNVAFERGQIGKYLTANGGTLRQPTAIVIVSDTSIEETPQFTTDGKALNDALEQKTIALRTLRRSAGFYGAQERLDVSLKAMGSILTSLAATPGHKSVLWISPGWPLLSGPGIDLTNRDQQQIFREVVTFSNLIHAANATIYSLDPLGTQEDLTRTFYYREFVRGVRKPSQAQIGDLGLQVLAEQSGGLVFNGNNSLVKLMEQSTAEVDGTYTMTFTPPPTEPGAGYQQLDIHLTDPNLKARITQGIYTAPR